MKAILFAAGLGTRLKPLTNDRPKALVEIKDGVTLLHHNLLYLKSYGVKTVVVNIHHFGEKVLAELEKHRNFGLDIIISDERAMILETGGGLKKAAKYLKDSGPFFVLNVDVLSNINLHKMLDQHYKNKALATLAVRNRKSSRYLLFNEKQELCGWRNTKTEEIKMVRSAKIVSDFAFSGIHIISPDFLDLMTQEGKFSITTTYLEVASKHPIWAYPHDEDYWFDVGKPEKLQAAKDFLFLNS